MNGHAVNRGAIALVACLLGATARAESGAGLTICNGDDNQYRVAMLVRYPVFLQERWESSGWYHIAPGTCERWSYGSVNTLYILSITQDTKRGRKALNYGVDVIPDWHWDTGSYGMQDFFCVSDQPFGRKAANQDAYRRCRVGEYLQLFNLHVFVEHNTSFKVDLN